MEHRQYGYVIEVLIEYEDLLGNKYGPKLLTSITKSLYSGEDPLSGGPPSPHSTTPTSSHPQRCQLPAPSTHRQPPQHQDARSGRLKNDNTVA